MGITIQADVSFATTQSFLKKVATNNITSILDKYGAAGVTALSAATPTRTGETAHSWYYTIKQSKGSYEIVWKNSHVINGANIALLIQYGHGTKNGGYVTGRDYINPAMRTIFEQIVTEIRGAVKR